MSFHRSFVALLALLTLSGCGTVFRARQAQESVRARAEGTHVTASRLDLAGFSLCDLVGFALTNRPSMTSAALAVEDARLALKEIAADAPLVSATPWTAPHASASTAYRASSVSAPSLHGRTDGSVNAGLSLNILLNDFGRNRARAQAQAARVVAEEHACLEEGYTVFEEVVSSCLTLRTKEALLEVAQTNETECALRLRQAEERFAAGEARRLDVTSAKLELSQARESLVAASNEVATAGAELMRALGVDVSRGTRAEVSPPDGAALAVVRRAFAQTDFGAAEAFDLARTNAPAVALARARLRAAKAQVDAAVADLMPSVSAEVGVSWADPFWAWQWGVSVVQSIFEGFRKTTAVDRAVVQMQQAAAAVDAAEQDLSLRLETAVAARDDARKALETARVSVADARENLDTVKTQYQSGDASRVDYTVALSTYVQALGRRVSAFYAEQTAESRLFALLGRLPDYDEAEIRER